MTEVRDEEFVALQLRHNVEEDTLVVSLVVRADVQIEAVAPAAHVLTCVTQRIDRLLPGDDPRKADLGDAGLRGFTVCDPGGILQLTDDEGLKIIIEGLMEGCGSIREMLGEVVDGEEEE